ncbi:MAG: hypothetical protein WC058_04645 [Phycisphaeraceae bacterium]
MSESLVIGMVNARFFGALERVDTFLQQWEKETDVPHLKRWLTEARKTEGSAPKEMWSEPIKLRP